MLTAAIVIAGWIAGYFVLRSILQRNVRGMHLQVEKELKAVGEFPADGRSRRPEAGERINQITPKNISALGESLSAFMGQEVQIRAVKRRPISNPLSNPWAREGCILVQNSHDLEISRSKTQFIHKPARASTFDDVVGKRAA